MAAEHIFFWYAIIFITGVIKIWVWFSFSFTPRYCRRHFHATLLLRFIYRPIFIAAAIFSSVSRRSKAIYWWWRALSWYIYLISHISFWNNDASSHYTPPPFLLKPFLQRSFIGFSLIYFLETHYYLLFIFSSFFIFFAFSLSARAPLRFSLDIAAITAGC